MPASTLLIATLKDVASVNIASQLVRRYRWQEIALQASVREASQRVFRCPRTVRKAPLYMWLVDESLLSLNFANEKFLSLWTASDAHLPRPESVRDILFLSKHAAASGKLSLTVHPVGIPWVLPEDEENCLKSGGIAGRCSPPSAHIGPLLRAVLAETKTRGLDAMFSVTLEATHHGPYVPVPACFVEIGSTEAEWDNVEAGQNWSECLGDYFQLQKRDEVIEQDGFDLKTSQVGFEGEIVSDQGQVYDEESGSSEGVVMVAIGSGHYVPKMNDMAKFGDEFFVGHALATYALQDHWLTMEGDVPKWKKVIIEAIESTRIVHPTRPVVCYIDKKSFNADQRDKITSCLEELGVRWSFKASDIKAWRNMV